MSNPDVRTAAKLTGLSEHFIRTKVISGGIAAVKAGCKYLVNADKLIGYLNCHTEPAEVPKPECCGITPVGM